MMNHLPKKLLGRAGKGMAGIDKYLPSLLRHGSLIYISSFLTQAVKVMRLNAKFPPGRQHMVNLSEMSLPLAVILIY